MSSQQSDRNPSQERRERSRSVASELREYAEGNLPVDHSVISPAAVLVDDDDLREHLIFAERAYNRRKEPGEPDFWETGYVRDRLPREASRVVTDAVQNSQLSVMEFVTGLPDWTNDVSGLHTIRKMEEYLVHDEQTRLIYIAALMGRGKTDFALTLLQIVHWHFRRANAHIDDPEAAAPEPEFAANFHVEGDDGARVRHIDNYDDLLKWGKTGSSDDERWFIFDEASTELTAQSGKNAQDVAEIFAPFVKKMRKMGINMVVIGHDRGDVHVAIRSIADYIDKESLKRASIYQGISSREPVGHELTISGIPQTTWEFDTDDTAEWSWGTAIEDDSGPDLADTFDPSKSDGIFEASQIREWRNQVIADLYDESEDLTQQDIADAMGISRRTVANAT